MKKILDNLIDIKSDGTFKLNMKFLTLVTGLTMTNKNFSNLFGQLPRNPKKDLLTQFHMDIAASIQKVTEDIILKLENQFLKNTK